MFINQSALIEQLIQLNHKLDSRLSMMEVKVYNKTQPKATHERSEDKSDVLPANKAPNEYINKPEGRIVLLVCSGTPKVGFV